jgi:hypothetical protein
MVTAEGWKDIQIIEMAVTNAMKKNYKVVSHEYFQQISDRLA